MVLVSSEFDSQVDRPQDQEEHSSEAVKWIECQTLLSAVAKGTNQAQPARQEQTTASRVLIIGRRTKKTIRCFVCVQLESIQNLLIDIIASLLW